MHANTLHFIALLLAINSAIVHSCIVFHQAIIERNTLQGVLVDNGRSVCQFLPGYGIKDGYYTAGCLPGYSARMSVASYHFEYTTPNQGVFAFDGKPYSVEEPPIGRFRLPNSLQSVSVCEYSCTPADCAQQSVKAVEVDLSAWIPPS